LAFSSVAGDKAANNPEHRFKAGCKVAWTVLDRKLCISSCGSSIIIGQTARIERAGCHYFSALRTEHDDSFET
jgi:hypothetical protein